MASLTIKNAVKRFGAVEVIKDVSLDLNDGEFLVLLGASGCGKSTLLNMIAGLEAITEGEIMIGDRVVNDVHPKDRDIAMVFQSYALYPNMTVEKNIAFGLEMRGVPKDERNKLVTEVATMLQIDHLLDRKPAQLSGGQRQRVAMGRALVRRPEIFLFDEPLSNLDAKLRLEMRTEIKRLHKELNATIVYVTHDQIEAMTLADRIAILKDGIVQQYATPAEIYNKPANIFIASLVGSPPMNFLNARLEKKDSDIVAHVPLSRDKNGPVLDLSLKGYESDLTAYIGKEVVIGIRPENISYTEEPVMDGHEVIEGEVDVVEPTGADTLCHIKWGINSVLARINNRIEVAIGDKFNCAIDMKRTNVFDKDTEERI
ncbi:ABC transporter ATP-binding protein [uncultured Cohaesibacter sp.]|uniref:ABC transporter ATP-binding protein n=1 Tax=uncultured Cohaesibacter sp. TaxID=1002546 RepID=UPI0029C7A03A|nr:ABC transporter ATP-binding protein [uncultured Cohaesibacter sp.]